MILRSVECPSYPSDLACGLKNAFLKVKVNLKYNRILAIVNTLSVNGCGFSVVPFLSQFDRDKNVHFAMTSYAFEKQIFLACLPA